MKKIRDLRATACVSLLAFLLFFTNVPGAKADPQTGGGWATRQASRNLDLDLSSSNASVMVSPRLFGQASSVNIQVAGNTRAVMAGDMLTPAEFVALTQVLRTGAQNLVLDTQGRASGGTFSLTAMGANQLSSLVIPANVTAQAQGLASILNVAGQFSTQGTLSGATRHLVVNAGSVDVGVGGVVTTVSPNNRAVDLSIASLANIYNSGSITASGVLTLTAQGDIVNALPSGITGPAPVMSGAMGSNLFAGSGQFVNSGMIASQSGSVNFATGATTDLVLNNAGGQVQALQAINMRDAMFAGKQLTGVTGGSFTAREANFYSGDGHVNVHTNQMAALANIYAGTASMVNTSGDLNVGTMTLSGDPTIANSDGDVTLNGNLTTGGADLAIIASGNVLVAPGAKIAINLSTNVPDATAGSLHIVSGFDFTPATPGQVTDNTTTFTFPEDGDHSASGGGIGLSGVTINTSSTASTGEGSAGNVILIAALGTSPTQDHTPAISVGAINATSKKGTGGIVFVVGEGGVTIAGIDVSGATAAGTIDISSSSPEISGGDITFLNGTVGGDGFFFSGDLTLSPVLINGKVTANGTQGPGGGIGLVSAGSVTVTGAISANGGTLGGEFGGGFDAGALGVIGETVSLASVSLAGGASSSPAPAGLGGVFDIFANSGAAVNGHVNLKGGDGKSSLEGSDAGFGGMLNVDIASPSGTFSVRKGSIDARGGNAGGGGSGADGGSVTVLANNLLVEGSINVSGGNSSGAFFLGGLGGAINFAGTGNYTINGDLLLNGGNATGMEGAGGSGGFLIAEIPGGSFTVNGAINAFGGSGSGGPGGGGDVNITANQVLVDGNIYLAGANSTMAFALGGFGGSAFVSAVNSIRVNGNIVTRGGSNKSTVTEEGAAGGDAGSVILETALATDVYLDIFDAPSDFRIGSILVTGYIDARGGDVSAADGVGGLGNDVVLAGSTVQVMGKNGNFSVSSSGGTAPVSMGTQGDPGIITVETFGTQPLPTNFNLTSTTKSEFALPGGLFNIGNASVNGTAAPLVAGAFSATSQNAGNVIGHFATGSDQITIDTFGNSFNVIGVTGPVTSGLTGTTRNKVTPGVALALFQVTRDTEVDAQTIGLNPAGQVTDINPALSASPSVLKTASSDFFRPFTTFNLATAQNNLVQVAVFGESDCTIDLSLASLINIAGQVLFVEPFASTMNFGGKSPNIAAGGQIAANSTGFLTISSTNATWTLNGIIVGDTLTLINPSGGTNLMMSATGQLRGYDANSTLFLSAVKNFNIVNSAPGFTPPMIDDLTISGSAASIQIGSVPKSGPAAPIFLGSDASFFALVATTGTLGIVALGNIETQSPLGPAFLSGAGGLSLQTSGNIVLDSQAMLTTPPTSKSAISISAANIILGGENLIAGGGPVTLNASQQITETASDNELISTSTLTVIGQQGMTLAEDLFASNADIHITGLNGTITLIDCFINAGTSATIGKYLPTKGTQFNFTGSLDVGGFWLTRSGLTVDANSVIIGDHSTLFNTFGSGSINITSRVGDLEIEDAVTIAAGALAAAPPPGVLSTNNILFKGNVNVTAQNGLFLHDGVFMQSVGGDVKLLSTTANISWSNEAPNGEIRADGGNIVMAALGNITNNDEESVVLFARAVGTAKAFTGGGISLNAGTANLVQANTDLVNALKTRPATFQQVPNPFTGFGVTLIAGTKGVAKATFGSVDSIDMAINGNTSTFNVNGGVITLTTVGPTAVIEMDNVSATALAPIAFHADTNSMNAEGSSELIVDTGDDFNLADEDQDMALAK